MEDASCRMTGASRACVRPPPVKCRLIRDPDRFTLQVSVPVPHNAVIKRIRAEYLEMPGLRLTIEQAQRLCGVDGTICRAVLDALVDTGFLCVKADGTYARLTEGALPRPRPAKADLGPSAQPTKKTAPHR